MGVWIPAFGQGVNAYGRPDFDASMIDGQCTKPTAGAGCSRHSDGWQPVFLGEGTEWRELPAPARSSDALKRRNACSTYSSRPDHSLNGVHWAMPAPEAEPLRKRANVLSTRKILFLHYRGLIGRLPFRAGGASYTSPQTRPIGASYLLRARQNEGFSTMSRPQTTRRFECTPTLSRLTIHQCVTRNRP